MSTLYIITGSNGAGKSSIGKAFIPGRAQHLIPFDGDKIFLEKKKDLRKKGIKVDKEVIQLASDYTDELFDKLSNDALNSHSDFIYEGHFSQESSWDLPKKFKESGYDMRIIFLGLLDVEQSVSRVKERAFAGGHDVDILTLTENFYGNMKKLNEHFLMFNNTQIIDTSETLPRPLITLKGAAIVEAEDAATFPAWVKENLPAIYQLV